MPSEGFVPKKIVGGEENKKPLTFTSKLGEEAEWDVEDTHFTPAQKSANREGHLHNLMKAGEECGLTQDDIKNILETIDVSSSETGDSFDRKMSFKLKGRNVVFGVLAGKDPVLLSFNGISVKNSLDSTEVKDEIGNSLKKFGEQYSKIVYQLNYFMFNENSTVRRVGREEADFKRKKEVEILKRSIEEFLGQ